MKSSARKQIQIHKLLRFLRFEHLNFDIDEFTNWFVPTSRLERLPRWVSWWFGYRDEVHKVGDVVVWTWACVGAFASLALIQGIVLSSRFLQSEGVPIVVASFGAAAILEFHTLESPLAQPRPALFGHFLSAFVGVSITKLFALSSRFNSTSWLAGALSVGVASTVMGITHTIHPPAGATALLAATDPTIRALGWKFLPVILVSALVMLVVALFINNLQRRYPMYWWMAAEISLAEQDTEKESGVTTTAINNSEFADDKVVVSRKEILVPEWLYLAEEEESILEVLKQRLAKLPMDE